MEKITITIPDNLTPEQEVLEIAKHIGAKLLPIGNKPIKMISNAFEIKHPETYIVIKREQIEKPIVTHECSVCKTIFEKTLGKYLYTNYGGKIRKVLYCSIDCCQYVINFVGEGRASIQKKDIQLTKLW